MRTKALLCLAALAASAMVSMAQSNVYSLNIVGYVNVPAIDGNDGAGGREAWLTPVANPLKNLTVPNTIANILTNIPDSQFGCNYFAWVTNRPGYFNTYTYFGGGAWDSDVSMLPGEPGVLSLTDGSGSATNTFVGEVMTGTNAHAIYVGLNMLSSYVPKAATLDAMGAGAFVGFGENAFIWNFSNQSWTTYTSLGGGPGGWDPGDPAVGVAEPFFIDVTVGGTWNEPGLP